MAQKDLFSGHSSLYAAFRPAYPDSLYQFIFSHLKDNKTAWDCATGNGQVARYLSKHFKNVYATDLSQQQLDNAFPADNIQYSISPAEKTPFQDNQFDLITVGQALHWFNREQFYNEVNRVGKPGAMIAVWGYALLFIEPDIDQVIMDFYTNVVGPYWDDARRLVENEYKTIPFPFEEIETPPFFIDVEWNLDHLTGYLESWSATQKYMKATNINPIPSITERLKPLWSDDDPKNVSFPLFLRLGKIQ
jgi:hypothetical protein